MKETGLRLEIIDGAAEAELATVGCGSLFENHADHIIVFDIGGGSTEIMRLDKETNGFFKLADVASVPIGVVRLAERFGGPGPHDHGYDEMVGEARVQLQEFFARQSMITDMEKLQIIGTSGTVTTLAAVQLGLAKYDRNVVDGCKITASDVRRVIDELRGKSRDELAANPCIGKQRADLVLAGCAVLDVIHQHWAVEKFCVADRGLREGILLRMIRRDPASGAPRKTSAVIRFTGFGCGAALLHERQQKIRRGGARTTSRRPVAHTGANGKGTQIILDPLAGKTVKRPLCGGRQKRRLPVARGL